MSDLFDPSVNPDLAWKDLFRKDMSPETRRKRWEDWKEATIKSGRPENVEYWQMHHCEDCDQRDGDWCELQGLPCTVNPILTFQYNMLGMACYGAYSNEEEERSC